MKPEGYTQTKRHLTGRTKRNHKTSVPGTTTTGVAPNTGRAAPTASLPKSTDTRRRCPPAPAPAPPRSSKRTSRNNRLGSVTNSTPMVTRLRSPPLMPRSNGPPMMVAATAGERPSSAHTASTRASTSAAERDGGSRRRALNVSVSRTVRCANRELSCTTYAASCLNEDPSRGDPLTRTVPLALVTPGAAGRRPARRLRSVVLPDPAREGARGGGGGKGRQNNHATTPPDHPPRQGKPHGGEQQPETSAKPSHKGKGQRDGQNVPQQQHPPAPHTPRRPAPAPRRLPVPRPNQPCRHPPPRPPQRT